jgi:recombination associated protein RdgC
MWFKNLMLYRLSEPVQVDPEAWAAAMASEAFRPCGGLEPHSTGWSPPLGRLGEALVHSANGCTAVCMRREERLLPGPVVREELEDRIARIEGAEGRAVRGRERRRMRDEVIFELMPRAFTRSNHVAAYIAPQEGWLVVDSASARTSEELVVLLTHSLGGLPVVPFDGPESGQRVLTRWLDSARLPEGFALADECELRDPADKGAVVRCLRQDLRSAEIGAHLAAHKQVEKLGLAFEDSLGFVLCADLSLRRLRFLNVDALDEMDELDPLARFDANFSYMSGEINRLLRHLGAAITNPDS